MIKISISLLLDAIEENINDEELQSIDFESYIRKITKEFKGENGEFLVKEEAFETLPLDRDKKDIWDEVNRRASCKFNCRTIKLNFCYIASQYISLADLNLKIFLG